MSSLGAEKRLHFSQKRGKKKKKKKPWSGQCKMTWPLSLSFLFCWESFGCDLKLDVSCNKTKYYK